MRQSSSLNAIMPRTRQGILAAMLVRPEKAWYVSELARQMGVPSSSLQRDLKSLTEAGILKSHRQGRMAYFQANSESPLFPELRGLMLKTAGLVDVLAAVLQPLASRLRAVFVYGSMADSTEHSDSDVDLMVVGSVTPVQLALPLRRAREQIGREINPKVYSVAEFTRKWSGKDHFLSRVLDKPKLFVIGNSDDLGEVVSR